MRLPLHELKEPPLQFRFFQSVAFQSPLPLESHQLGLHTPKRTGAVGNHVAYVAKEMLEWVHCQVR